MEGYGNDRRHEVSSITGFCCFVSLLERNQQGMLLRDFTIHVSPNTPLTVIIMMACILFCWQGCRIE